MRQKRYDSDLTDSQWDAIKFYFPDRSTCSKQDASGECCLVSLPRGKRCTTTFALGAKTGACKRYSALCGAPYGDRPGGRVNLAFCSWIVSRSPPRGPGELPGLTPINECMGENATLPWIPKDSSGQWSFTRPTTTKRSGFFMCSAQWPGTPSASRPSGAIARIGATSKRRFMSKLGGASR